MLRRAKTVRQIGSRLSPAPCLSFIGGLNKQREDPPFSSKSRLFGRSHFYVLLAWLFKWWKKDEFIVINNVFSTTFFPIISHLVHRFGAPASQVALHVQKSLAVEFVVNVMPAACHRAHRSGRILCSMRERATRFARRSTTCCAGNIWRKARKLYFFHFSSLRSGGGANSDM